MRGACAPSLTPPMKVPLALPSSTRMYSLPRWRMVACRWLTLGSGSLTSEPSPRPMTTMGESKVMERLSFGGSPLGGAPERTSTVTGIAYEVALERVGGRENCQNLASIDFLSYGECIYPGWE